MPNSSFHIDPQACGLRASEFKRYELEYYVRSRGTVPMKELIFYFRDNWLAVAAFLVSIGSFVFTVLKNVKDRNYAKDKELLEQLKQSMRLAYEAVEDSNGLPTNIRTRWLTSARHIVRYRELKKSLKTQLYRTICDEQEEYWSNRFYTLLQGITKSSFFGSINSEEMEEEQIEPRSAALVYSMSVWPKDKPDPIDTESFEAIVQRYGLFSPLYLPFPEYIRSRHQGLAEKVNGRTSS